MAPKLHIQILPNLAIKKNQKQVDLLIRRILPDNSPFLARLFLPGILPQPLRSSGAPYVTRELLHAYGRAASRRCRNGDVCSGGWGGLPAPSASSAEVLCA